MALGMAWGMADWKTLLAPMRATTPVRAVVVVALPPAPTGPAATAAAAA